MSFERTVILPVNPDTAFTLVTDPERLRRWQTVACRMNLRVSGSYRFTMGPGHHAAGTVTEIEPGRRQVLSWGWECSDAVPPGDSTLYITMEPHAEGTALTLRHERLDAGQSSGHAEGRNHFLDRLVRFAKAGHAVPDEWNATPEPADAITAAEASLAVLQLVLHHLQEKDLQRPPPAPSSTSASSWTIWPATSRWLARRWAQNRQMTRRWNRNRALPSSRRRPWSPSPHAAWRARSIWASQWFRPASCPAS